MAEAPPFAEGDQYVQNIYKYMPEIKFKFDRNQVVETPFGPTGIIIDAFISDAGSKQYHVKTSINSQWWREDQLKLATPLTTSN